MSNSAQPHRRQPTRLQRPWDSPGKNTGVGCYALLQGILPTQGLKPVLLHCRWILHCLSHQGSPRILEWVAYPLSRGSSWPRNQTGVACIASGFLTSCVTREVTQSVFYSLPIKNSFYILFIYLLLATPCCQVCGIEPLSPDMEGWSCNRWTAREVLGFTFLSCLKFKKEYVTDITRGPQNLKCLLSDQLQKKFANPCSRAQGPG